MKTIRDLRNEMIVVFKGIKSGRVAPQTAQEINNAAGKIIATARTELEYFALRKEKPTIPFLDKAKTRT